MNLSFSTLACPDSDIDGLIAKAKAYGYNALDLSRYRGESQFYKFPEFSTEINLTNEKIKKAGLGVSCLCSPIRLMTDSSDQRAEDQIELRKYCWMCKRLHTNYVRIFGGRIKDRSREAATHIALSHLSKLLSIAEEYQVVLLLETHGDWSGGTQIRSVMEQMDSPYFKLIWDVHHTYRIAGESPEQTWALLGEWIVHTHWKDSTLDDSEIGYRFCLPGEGDIPLKSIYRLLKQNRYSGYYTIEWEKFWHPEIDEGDVALRQYADYIHHLERIC
ncbi:sugar phosphate isomerase/epimerase [Sporolactobacillus shoreicorticis]|uniref:Sugar phosphate isomerase/epimerase family protein n=1 Tax=Sporolactobacillus shoreicorticis TaxID=1923877 RepID=A0ABW5S044_9BACL|nr:sugar phosphate isomerase/epimerase family protein [Sporolactobacillus shoreicorticis]MCO7124668.1 sugar phosphate isomerase/epimerase [Sporolactobacillus shoreicorticis]